MSAVTTGLPVVHRQVCPRKQHPGKQSQSRIQCSAIPVAPDGTLVEQPPSPYGSVEEAKSKPGRKWMDPVPGENKRAVQMREAQRAHRERKRAYIAELEAKVKALSESKQEPSSSGDVGALREWIVSLESENKRLRQASEEKNAFLEKQVNVLMEECAALRSVVASLVPAKSVSVEFANGSSVVDGAKSVETPLLFDELLGVQLAEGSTTANAALTNDAGLVWDEDSLLKALEPREAPASVSSASSVSPNFGLDALKSPADPVEQIISSSPESFNGVKSGSSLFADSVPVALSITDIFGPYKDLDKFRSELRSLPSLQNFEDPDRLFDLIMKQADCFELNSIRKCMIDICLMKFKIYDACNIVDKQKAIEIVEAFKERNKAHLNHLYLDSLMDPLAEPRRLFDDSACVVDAAVVEKMPHVYSIEPRLEPVRQAITSIPSLRGANELIDELCLQFSKRCTTVDKKSDKFFKHVSLSRKLQRMCATEEDRTKFMLMLEVARGYNKKILDDWIREAQV